MTEFVTAREIPSERPLAWRLAHDARVRYVLLVGALAGAYYGAAQIGYELKFTGAVAAIVWLPVGVGIAFLYLGGLSLWPGVVLGDLLANQYDTLPIGSAHRADDRQHARGARGRVPAAASSCGTAARWRAWPASAGCSIAIFAGTAVSATIGPMLVTPRRRAVDVGPAARLAHLVARGHRRRARRRAARARLVAAARLCPGRGRGSLKAR